MKKAYIFGMIGLAIVFAFAIIGFMGVPASADSQLTGDVTSLSEDVPTTSTSTCPLADSGSCPNAATCTGSCGANAGSTCSGTGSCSGAGSCGGGCQASATGSVGSCHG